MSGAARVTETPLSHSRGVALILVWLVPSLAIAQFVQYTPPGTVSQPQVLNKESLELAITEARWRAGPWRFDPWYALKDFTYNNNVFGTAENTKRDVTFTVGAGVRGYLPVGENLNFAFHALPEYVWWFELAERRNLNGRYGAGLFGYYDRLTLEAEATRAVQQRYVSSELELPVNILRQGGAGTLEFAFLERFSVFGSGSTELWEYDESGVAGPVGLGLLLLERRENVIRGGLRYRFENGLTLGAGLEHSDADFLRSVGDRSNEGNAPLVELTYPHARFQADVSVAFRSLEPKEGSLFREFDGTTGRFLFNWKPGSRLEYQLYGRRNLVYTISPRAAYFVDERFGVGVTAPLSWRIRARAFGEWGDNSYVMTDPSVEAQVDDVTAYGGSVGIQLGRGMELVLGLSRTNYDSNFTGSNRSIFRLTTSISMGGGGSPWL
jgi:hypothetical protein